MLDERWHSMIRSLTAVAWLAKARERRLRAPRSAGRLAAIHKESAKTFI